MRLLFFVLSLILSNSSAYAEYRVFLLRIEKPNEDPKMPPDVRLVESTLDPIQYPRYYPLAHNEKISYTQTWRCRGRTDNFKPYCKNPRAPATTTEDQIQPTTAINP